MKNENVYIYDFYKENKAHYSFVVPIKLINNNEADLQLALIVNIYK